MNGLLRVRAAHGHNRVTFIELFFDLVFVFAVTQLSHGLLEHFTLLGALETLLLLLAVWWVWVYTTWATNWIDPEKLPVRLMLLAMMLAGLLMSVSIPEAFAERGLLFALAYVFMQVGRTLFVIFAFRHNPVQRRNFQRILAWLLFSGLFWIAGGLAHDGTRLALWAVALGIEYVSPSLAFWVPVWGRSQTTDWDVEGGHFAERSGLFVIIALGESILITGATFAELEWTTPTVAAFVLSFIGSLALWWLYFDTVAEVGSHKMSESRDPGRIARLVYTYIHLFMVAGIIVSAVADGLVLAHPTGHTESQTMLTLLGGAAIYLVGNILFKWAILDRLPLSHLVGLVILALLVPAANTLSPVLLTAATTGTLVVIAIWETASRRWGAQVEGVHVGSH